MNTLKTPTLALALLLLPMPAMASHPKPASHPAAMHAKPLAPQHHLPNNQRDAQKPEKHSHVLFQSQQSTHANTEAYQVKQHFKYDRAHHITQAN
jgi:hypothetical protein